MVSDHRSDVWRHSTQFSFVGSCAAAIGSTVTFSPLAISHLPFCFEKTSVDTSIPLSKCRPSGAVKPSTFHLAIATATSGRMKRTVTSST